MCIIGLEYSIAYYFVYLGGLLYYMLAYHRFKLVLSTYVMLYQVALCCLVLRISVPSLTLCWSVYLTK